MQDSTLGSRLGGGNPDLGCVWWIWGGRIFILPVTPPQNELIFPTFPLPFDEVDDFSIRRLNQAAYAAGFGTSGCFAEVMGRSMYSKAH